MLRARRGSRHGYSRIGLFGTPRQRVIISADPHDGLGACPWWDGLRGAAE
ncbi:MAG: hypothetical protein INF98_06745 [Roseomonas sp.]|nr:hypothetical protein [Roseomonas sp.]MCA3314291.1 hypothetical protein [Roseomonas sp.]